MERISKHIFCGDGVEAQFVFPDLCVVASKGLVDIARAEHEESTAAAAGPWQQLREHVAKHHPEPRLDVLEGQILAGICAAVGAEPRGLAYQSDKELDEGVDHCVDGGIHCSRGSVTQEINRRDVINAQWDAIARRRVPRAQGSSGGRGLLESTREFRRERFAGEHKGVQEGEVCSTLFLTVVCPNF
jgi:hypothetical protein